MFGPALPPGFQRRPKAAAPPPAVVSSPPVEPQVESDSDSDTDTYGPVQPISHEEAEALAMAQKLKDIDARANPASKEPDSALQKTLQREEWMLVPPEASRGPLEGGSDKLKSRSFRRTAGPSSSQTISSVWTESPQQRQERLLKAALKGESGAQVDDEDEDVRKKRKRDVTVLSKAELETKERIERHNKQHRAKTLVEEYASSSRQTERVETEGQKKFDYERDMGRRRLGAQQTQELIRDAKQLDSRFSHGKKTFL